MTDPASDPAPPEGNRADRLRRVVTIVNLRGLHARAAARLVSAAERFSTPVEVSRDDEVVSARSIMGLMMLGAGRGTRIVLEADAGGWDAAEALEALAALVESGFDERD